MASNGSTLTSQVKETISNGISAAKGGVSGPYTVPAIINGADTLFSSSFPVYAPATGRQLHECTSASVSDALSAVTAAQNALKSWKNTRPAEKRKIFLKAADILESRAEEFGKYMSEETGCPDFWGGGFNVPVSADGLRDVAGRIGTIEGTVPTCSEDGTSALVVKEPFGVILGIAPW